MQELDALMEVAETLNGPDGCPWDRKQTFETLKKYLIEEAHEVVEAVDEQDDASLKEELGDLLYVILFYCILAKKENKFTFAEVLKEIQEKLIRRHPHVFGNVRSKNIEDIVYHWERIKKIEKAARTSRLDGIPKTLDILLRASKVLDHTKRCGYELPFPESINEEEQFAKRLLLLVSEAEHQEINLESCFRKYLNRYEKQFREKERQTIKEQSSDLQR